LSICQHNGCQCTSVTVDLRPHRLKCEAQTPTSTNDACYCFRICRPSGERGSRSTRSRHLRSSYCCSVYPAVRNSYRALLRSSSIREPSDPPLRVIFSLFFSHFILSSISLTTNNRWGDKASVSKVLSAHDAQAISIAHVYHMAIGHPMKPGSRCHIGTHPATAHYSCSLMCMTSSRLAPPPAAAQGRQQGLLV
jgi:hypothetical protein